MGWWYPAACGSYCYDSKRKLPIGKTHNLKTEATNPKNFFQKVFAELFSKSDRLPITLQTLIYLSIQKEKNGGV